MTVKEFQDRVAAAWRREFIRTPEQAAQDQKQYEKMRAIRQRRRLTVMKQSSQSTSTKAF